MCNLNVVITTDKLNQITRDCLPIFLTGVTQNSYEYNNDGDGIYFDSNKLVKGTDKLNLYNYNQDIINSNFIISHQRITTSGTHKFYTQPFEDDDFVLAHNGEISELAVKKDSDTFVFFKMFKKYFKKAKGNREQKIINCIRKIISKLTYGSYSIVIFDKSSQKLYYFKNTATTIYFWNNHNMLYITTKYNNDVFLNMLNVEFTELDIKPDIVYRVQIKKNKIKNID